MQAVVLAGGRGTRLSADADAPPKPLTPLCGLPVLDHIVGRLVPHGVRDVVFCTGYRAELVAQAMGDGARHGVRFRYAVESVPRGTAGAVRDARALLDDRFVVAYGDVVADVDLGAMLAAHARSGAIATLAVHPNDHPFDSDRVVADRHGVVERVVRKGRDAREGAEAGALCSAALYVLDKRALDYVPDDAPSDFAHDVFPAMLRAGERVLAWRTTEYLKDMGTGARRERVEQDLRDAVPARMRVSEPKPAVLLDRDGVLIADVPYVRDVREVSLVAGAAPALRRLNAARTLAVCCTNQPVVARGELSEDGLHTIHRYLEGLLGAEGAWLDAIYYCPHHPDGGYAGERAELKFACDCRKPRPGLLRDAEAALGIDRRQSVFVGDRSADLLAARAAGVLAVGVRTGAACRDGHHAIAPEVPIVPSLTEAVALVLDTAPSWQPWLDRVLGARCVLLGGPSRAGKTLAANALRLALGARGVPTVHYSLDRFIQPRSRRRDEATAHERNGFDDAQAAVRALCDGRAVVLPAYDPLTREQAAGEVAQWSGRGVLVLDGVLANAITVPGRDALNVALVADEATLRERRRAFYTWKGLTEAEMASALDGRAEEAQAVRRAQAAAQLVLALGEGLVLGEARS